MHSKTTTDFSHELISHFLKHSKVQLKKLSSFQKSIPIWYQSAEESRMILKTVSLLILVEIATLSLSAKPNEEATSYNNETLFRKIISDARRDKKQVDFDADALIDLPDLPEVPVFPLPSFGMGSQTQGDYLKFRLFDRVFYLYFVW